MTRLAAASLALLIGACGPARPPADMPARSSDYYMAHPEEIAPMQAICRQWSESKAPIGTVPSVIISNCRDAAFAKSMLAVKRAKANRAAER